jgi:dTDP-glucose 4,6-dehydratase
MLEQGYQVVVIDNLSDGSHPELLPALKRDKDFTFYQKNVHGSEAIDIIVNEDPQYIIHAAAYSDVDKSIKNPYEILKANCQANLNVFEAARLLPDLKKLVYISTDEVYGECGHRKKEDEIIFPKNPYSMSKAHGSLLRLAYDNSYKELKDKTAETRFCNVVGERQDDRKILPHIRDCLLNDKPIRLHNGGEGYREYIWVDNIPPAVEKVMLEGNRTYNITNNEGYTVNELVTLCEEITGKTLQKIPVERPGMDEMYQMDATRIRDLGWEPSMYFGEGLVNYLK